MGLVDALVQWSMYAGLFLTVWLVARSLVRG